MKNFLWGVLLFLLNLFIIYLNYTKNFSIPTIFFIEANQMMAFIVGLLYSQQCRKLDFEHILGIACNSLVFSVLTTIVFAIYGSPVTFYFTLILFVGIFVCMFISYCMYYWLFCPDKYKNRYKKKTMKKTRKKARRKPVTDTKKTDTKKVNKMIKKRG